VSEYTQDYSKTWSDKRLLRRRPSFTSSRSLKGKRTTGSESLRQVFLTTRQLAPHPAPASTTVQLESGWSLEITEKNILP
jgi:hypothetical protein